MRERLIELMNQAETRCANTERCVDCEYNGVDGCMAYNIVDHLLAEGVIVPPCKVGDTVYSIDIVLGCVVEGKVIAFRDVTDVIGAIEFRPQAFATPPRIGVLGKNVFLAREEAEKAFSERSKV